MEVKRQCKSHVNCDRHLSPLGVDFEPCWDDIGTILGSLVAGLSVLRFSAVWAFMLDSCALLLCLARWPLDKGADPENIVIYSVFLQVLLTAS